jgi:hypothetical protein
MGWLNPEFPQEVRDPASASPAPHATLIGESGTASIAPPLQALNGGAVRSRAASAKCVSACKIDPLRGVIGVQN